MIRKRQEKQQQEEAVTYQPINLSAYVPAFSGLSACSLIICLAAGCVLPLREKTLFLSASFGEKAPRRVAVLLFDNQSLDMLAPDMLRKMARERLEQRGYAVSPLPEADQSLHDLGISDGGQLRAFKPEELGRLLETDGLLYGTIEEFVYSDIGFGFRKAVRLRLSLLRAEDGEKLWENVAQESLLHIRQTKEEIREGVIESVAEKVLGNMAQRPLYQESVLVMNRLFATLPARQ